MKNTKIDFYSAFDNDGLEIFTDSDNCSRKVLTWYAYYRNILERLEPMIEDELNDLIRCYDEALSNSNINNKPCEVFNLEIMLSQLQNAVRPTDTDINQIYHDAENRIIIEMISLISEAIDKKISVYIRRIE
jgi:hypothetical protein